MERIEEFLEERKKKDLFRTLYPTSLRREGKIYHKGKEFFDFSSNDYLGLSEHPALKASSRMAIEEFGTSACGSRLLSGDLEMHHKLEEAIAVFKGKEAGLVFNSGYQANVGIISAICGRGDVIFSDRLNHASLLDGAVLSGAKLFRFLHNDLSHLESLLKTYRGRFKNSLIITETIFSMDGDRPPLKELVGLKQKYDCIMMVDEAHATGVFGENGAGVVEEEGLANDIELVMGTFSKALGSFGGYIASSNKMKEFLINACRSFIYSTALPPSVIAANLTSLDLIKEEPYRRKTVLDNASLFRARLEKYGFSIKGSSQIIPLIVEDAKLALELSRRLEEKGYRAFAIRPPTVPPKEARIRFSLTHHHTKDILETLANDIYEVYRKG